MQVRIEDVSPVEKKLIVEVPWKTVNTKLVAAYRGLAREVNLKGFRRGKVPRSVLERMFGKRVKAEVASQLVHESFMNAVGEHSLEAVSEPIVEQELVIKKGEPFHFEAKVEVRGEVEVSDYEGMELNRRPVKVEDESVDAALEALQREHTELMPIEGRDVTARTDILSIKIAGTLGDREIERDGLPVDLENEEHSPLPGLVEALRGIPIDAADHEIEITIPEDYHDSEIAGAVGKFTISVLDARRKEVPELDDELAKDSGKADTLEELRAVTRKELEDAQEETIKREVRDAALKELVKRNQIPVASALTERAMEMQLHRLKMMLGMQADEAGGLSDDLREKMRPSAEDEVRGQLLLDAVGKQEKIEVTEEEIDAHFAKLAKMRGTQAARLRAEYDRDGRLDNVRFQIQQDKVLDLLVSKATVTEKEPEPEPEPEDATSPDGEVDAEETAAEDSAKTGPDSSDS
jgi:trigger factor